ncbi:MAG: hypothetical protein H6Q99_3270 [Proteobacteria bacterium]|nr:hypothetical protein [Pseudomonadota bacterium]
MHGLRFLAAFSVCVMAASAAVAGPILDEAKAAEALLSEGKAVEALASLEAAFNVAWDAAPLSFSEATFVTGKPAGFGIYATRTNTVFLPDEQMLVYAEPFGYSFGKDGDLFKIDFSADFELRTPRGQILHAQEGFASLDMVSRRRNKEFQVYIVYNFKGLKPGDYVLVTKLSDRNSEKKGEFELPFTVAEKPAD